MRLCPGFRQRYAQKGGGTLHSDRTQAIVSTLKIGVIIGIGFAAGVLSGLLGVGGGVILVPAMVYLLGLSQHQAHGTSLAVIFFVVVLSASLYSVHGEVDWVIAIEMAVGGVFGAVIGAKVANLLSGRRLRRYFGLFLILIAVRMISDVFSALAGGPHVNSHPWALPVEGLTGIALVVGVGVLTGVLSGLLGVGGGIVMIPAMVILLGLPQKLAQGISLAVIIPVSLSGTLIHAKHGNIRGDIWYWLVVGGVLGALIGARAAIDLPPSVLRGAFSFLVLVVGVLMFLRRPGRGGAGVRPEGG